MPVGGLGDDDHRLARPFVRLDLPVLDDPKPFQEVEGVRNCFLCAASVSLITIKP